MIELVPCDIQWPRMLEAERVVLERVLAAWLHVIIEHIGSTAVPGLMATLITDIVASVGSVKPPSLEGVVH